MISSTGVSIGSLSLGNFPAHSASKSSLLASSTITAPGRQSQRIVRRTTFLLSACACYQVLPYLQRPVSRNSADRSSTISSTDWREWPRVPIRLVAPLNSEPLKGCAIPTQALGFIEGAIAHLHQASRFDSGLCMEETYPNAYCEQPVK